MRSIDILFVLVSVSLSSLSQIILKKGMTDPVIQKALESSGFLDTVLTVVKSPMVIGGLGCFGLSAVVWLFVLSRIPLSLAYPFVALGIVVTVTAGITVLGETVAWQSLAGVTLIVGGVVIVGLSA